MTPFLLQVAGKKKKTLSS